MHVLIAGGVTPMMSMIRTLADQGDVGARACGRRRTLTPPGSVASMHRPRSMQLFITRPDSIDPLPRAARVRSRLHPRDVQPAVSPIHRISAAAAKGLEG
jgi:ferredoxin-NADP reductase